VKWLHPSQGRVKAAFHRQSCQKVNKLAGVLRLLATPVRLNRLFARNSHEVWRRQYAYSLQNRNVPFRALHVRSYTAASSIGRPSHGRRERKEVIE